MDITIRKVSPKEAHDYVVLHNACWKDAYTGIIPDEYLDNMSATLEDRAESIRKSISDPGDCMFYCIMSGDDMVGRLIFNKSSDEDKPEAGDVMAIYLLKEYWGKGYGKQMMDFAIAELRRAGHQEIIVWVLEENSMGIRFYEKYGFVPDGAKKEFDLGKPLTCLRYVLDLEG